MGTAMDVHGPWSQKGSNPSLHLSDLPQPIRTGLGQGGQNTAQGPNLTHGLLL